MSTPTHEHIMGLPPLRHVSATTRVVHHDMPDDIAIVERMALTYLRFRETVTSYTGRVTAVIDGCRCVTSDRTRVVTIHDPASGWHCDVGPTGDGSGAVNVLAYRRDVLPMPNYL